MTAILHPPEDVSFSGHAIAADDRARIASALRAAVLRAIENADGETATRPWPDHSPASMAGGLASQDTFDPARAHLDEGSYQLPSYRDEGRLTGVKLLESRPEAAPGYEVRDEPSPLEGGLIMSLPGLHYVTIGSPRYVTAGTLTQAYLMGLAVFGATSFAIVQGPWGSPKIRYWAISTDPAVSDADLGRAVAGEGQAAGLLPAGLAGKAEFVSGENLEVKVAGRDGGEYLTRGLVTTDRMVHWKTPAMAAAWFAQAQAERRQGVTAPPAEEFRRVVFGQVDQLVSRIEGGDDTDLQRAAELLSRLDWVAFSLVGWETKAGYVKVLLAAWTWQPEERAIVQIFRSLRSDSEVDAVLALLKQAGRYDQLFDDLDNELYELLVTVGERFSSDHGPLTFDGLIRLLQSMDLMARSPKEALLGSVLAGPGDRTIPDAMFDEAHDAVMGFVQTAAGIGESLATVFTDPQKTAEGIAGLAQLLVKVELASYGYQPAAQEIARLLASLGEKILAGARGADRLGCGPKVVRRIKWRLVWEIAALFVGFGEIKAVVQGAAKLPGVLRVLAVLARLGEAADLEVEGARLARLAELIRTSRPVFASVEEAADLVSRLPEKDLRHLGRLIAKADIKEGETLAELAVRSPGLHAAVEDAMAKTELIKTMAGRAGGLTEEIAAAAQILLGEDGLPLADAQKVVAAIPEGEGARFAATLKQIPLGRLAEGPRAAFLELVARSPGRMDAFARLGADTFWSVYRRAGGQAQTLDRYLAALDAIEAGQYGPEQAAGFRRLLDLLDWDDPVAWSQVEEVMRQRDVAEEFAEAARQGIPPGQPEGTHATGQALNPRTRAGVTDAELLAANLERTLGPRPPGHHAHHIVPKGMAEAEEAWDILERAHIGINDAENGVWLPADFTVANPATGEIHATIHTRPYVRWVTAELRDALAEGGPEAVAAKLRELRSIIMNGRAVR